MTVGTNYACGITYQDFQNLENIKGGFVRETDDASVLSDASNESNYAVSESGETCTDGKDDGKIGLLSCIGNAVKGAAKTAVNAVKGCFTDSEGNFSIGKTLATVGTVAVCTAFPAVGLAACAVGGVMGAVQVGKGVYNAATAETDAEAKEAWQNIGGGALTVGVSAVGAKASYNAVEASAAAANEGATALNTLPDNAGILQKAAALGEDCVTSTKYNASQIATSAAETAEALKIKSLQNKASKIEGIEGDISNIDNSVYNNLNAKDQSVIRELSAKEGFMTDSTKAKLDTINSVSESVSNAASTAKNTVVDAAKHPINTAKSTVSSIKNIIKSSPEAVKSATSNLSKNGQAVLDALQSTDSSYAQLVQEYGYESVMEVMEAIAGIEVSNQAV